MTYAKLRLGKAVIDEDGVLHGKIGGLGLGSIDVISEDATSLDEKPYKKLIGNPLGGAYEIGAAFPREKDGMKYYSVKLDSPVLPSPIHAVFFPDRNDPQTFDLVWNRWDLPKSSLDATTETGQPSPRRYVGMAATP